MPNTSFIIFHAFTNIQEISINFILDKSFAFFLLKSCWLMIKEWNPHRIKTGWCQSKGHLQTWDPQIKHKQILEDILSGWQRLVGGGLRGVRGMFPANFVQVISVKILPGRALHGWSEWCRKRQNQGFYTLVVSIIWLLCTCQKILLCKHFFFDLQLQ